MARAVPSPAPCRRPFWGVWAGAAAVAAAAAATRAPRPVGRDERREGGGEGAAAGTYTGAPRGHRREPRAAHTAAPPHTRGGAPRPSWPSRAAPPPSTAAWPCPRWRRPSAVSGRRPSLLPLASIPLPRPWPLPATDGTGVAPPPSSLRRLHCPFCQRGWPVRTPAAVCRRGRAVTPPPVVRGYPAALSASRLPAAAGGVRPVAAPPPVWSAPSLPPGVAAHLPLPSMVPSAPS